MMARRAALWLAVLGRTASAANYVGGQCVVGVTSGDLFPDKCAYGTQFAATVSADSSSTTLDIEKSVHAAAAKPY